MPFPEHPLIMGKLGQCRGCVSIRACWAPRPGSCSQARCRERWQHISTLKGCQKMFLLGQSQVGVMATEDGVWMQKASHEPTSQGRLVRLMYLWLSWHLFKPPLQQGEETIPGDSKGQPLVLCPDLLSPHHLTLPLKAAAPLCHLSPSSRKGAGSSWLAAEKPGN